MGYIIGETEEFSTWGRCRTPIFRTYFGWQSAIHNVIATDGWATQAKTFFRCAEGPGFVSWTDPSSGLTQTGFEGAFAFPGPPFPASPAFYVGTFNGDPAEPYAPNNLDDVEIQNYWVGRSVVIDAATYSMDYSALNGVTGSFQTIVPSASVISFDL